MKHETVFNLYNDGWQGLIVEDAFQHPAKFSRSLIYWIVRTGIERGYWREGDLIIDPFAGVGLGGLACAAYGLQWLGVDLEPRFITLAEQTFALHEKSWRLMNLPVPRIVRGDSRNLAEILAGVGIGGGITSPPYADSDMHSPVRAHNLQVVRNQAEHIIAYGSSPGQLGAMPEGAPPISAITSPPFSQPETRDRYPVQDGSVSDFMGRAHTVDRQAQTDGNIAAMSGITSPPYGEIRQGAKDPQRGQDGGPLYADYGDASGQIGALDTNSYWGAVEAIYRQLYAIFSPGGHLAVVVKPLVRNKTLVNLPQMTLDLLVSIGFEPVTWIDAMLVAEGEQQSAWPEEVPHKRKARKSFFRLLAERKGSPRIDAEVVLVVRK